MFDDKSNITTAGRSFFGKLLVKYNDRAFRLESGRRLKFLVLGKGNSRKYVVVDESEVGTE
jgi:hypothetical protein